jgi:cellulose synthase/poly-beta-1,6-N-acetylglucosamine synthase-like glycosyltransferase
MSSFFTVLLVAAGVLLLVPTMVFFFEILLGSSTSSAGGVPASGLESCVAVLMPAHNEEAGLEATLNNVMPQLGVRDRVVVVADNCSDRTAEIARLLGAEVVDRTNLVDRGKGHALAHGIDYLRSNPPDSVIVVDADCVISSGGLKAMKDQILSTQGPVQMLNIMCAPVGSESRFAVAEFSWCIKNHIRPLGLSRLGLPCQLMGTGMGFPWAIAQDAHFASSNIVEDLELGIRLATEGKAPQFFTGACVVSRFPLTDEGQISQRRRWENGSLSMMLRHGWRTVLKGAGGGNSGLFSLGLDMLVPPLVTHLGFLLIYSVFAVLSALFLGIFIPLALGGAMLFLFGAALFLAWISKGKHILPPRLLLSVVPFVLAKFEIHFRKNVDGGWVRADRNKK